MNFFKILPKLINVAISKFITELNNFLSKNHYAFDILDKGLFMSSIIIDVYQDVKNGETVGTGLSKNTFTNGAGYIFATVVAGTR